MLVSATNKFGLVFVSDGCVPFETQLWVENLFLAFSPFLLQPPAQVQLRTSRASPAADEGGGGGGKEVKRKEVE